MLASATFDQRTGAFTVWAPIDDGGQERAIYEVTGYAGRGAGYNNPALEHVTDTGPLPRGEYAIRGPLLHARLGPLAFRLEQVSGRNFGRSGFYIHGPSAAAPSSSSRGCIILGRAARSAIAEYRPSRLTVYASRGEAPSTRTVTK